MDTGYNIVMIDDTNRNPRKLIVEYRRLNREDINNHFMTNIGQKTRQDQNSVLMYHLISN